MTLAKQSYKKKIEILWREYEPFAPNNFLKEAQKNFHQRWWEMYLTVGLLRLSNTSGFEVGTSKFDKGPDVKITYADGKCIWIEAVAPETGDRGKIDSVPEPKINTIEDFPERELLLRFTNALTAKREKFEKYLLDKIICQGDPCIVALSSCNLDLYASLLGSQYPAPLKVLAGCGNMVLSKNKPSYFSKRQPIEKASKETVPICLFEDPTFDSISAVLYSSSDPLNAPSYPESTFQMILNPRAKVPLPDRFFTNIDTWYFKKIEDGEVWKKIDKN